MKKLEHNLYKGIKNTLFGMGIVSMIGALILQYIQIPLVTALITGLLIGSMGMGLLAMGMIKTTFYIIKTRHPKEYDEE